MLLLLVECAQLFDNHVHPEIQQFLANPGISTGRIAENTRLRAQRIYSLHKSLQLRKPHPLWAVDIVVSQSWHSFVHLDQFGVYDQYLGRLRLAGVCSGSTNRNPLFRKKVLLLLGSLSLWHNHVHLNPLLARLVQ
jgi:hypothetical protein